MKTRKVYKAVRDAKLTAQMFPRAEAGDYASAFAFGLGSNARSTFYRRGKWAKPPEGSNPFLMVFGSLKRAKKFAKMHNSFFKRRIVFQAEARNCRRPTRKEMRDFDLPLGTLFADAVRLKRLA